eukprot:PhM_4_TR14814/c0_g1_i1/m.2915
MADIDTENPETTEQHKIHIRVQQRNGRKSVTTIQGLGEEIDHAKLLKAVKKEFGCNGNRHGPQARHHHRAPGRPAYHAAALPDRERHLHDRGDRFPRFLRQKKEKKLISLEKKYTKTKRNTQLVQKKKWKVFFFYFNISNTPKKIIIQTLNTKKIHKISFVLILKNVPSAPSPAWCEAPVHI